jgi:hypothetical protein
MKVVFSCVPQTGHITPLLPLAEAFTANGDEVIIASGPDAEDVASSRGLPFRSVGSPFDSWFAALSAGRGGFPVTDSPGWVPPCGTTGAPQPYPSIKGSWSIPKNPLGLERRNEGGTQSCDAVRPPPAEIAIGQEADQSEYAERCADPAQGSIAFQGDA